MKEQFINDINDDNMMAEIITYITTIEKANENTSDQMLPRTRRVEVQRAQKAILNTTKSQSV